MNTLFRGLGLGVVLSAALILSGCSTDNETEASKAAGTGNVPTPEKGTTVEGGPQPKTIEEYAQQQQQQQNNMYSGAGYPGAPGGAAAKGGAPAPAPATKK